MFLFAAKKFKKNLTKLKKYKEILIEEYIGGREIQAAILGDKKLGVIELKPRENSMIIKQNIILILKQNI